MKNLSQVKKPSDIKKSTHNLRKTSVITKSTHTHTYTHTPTHYTCVPGDPGLPGYYGGTVTGV
jgi:hypothetical protein